MNEILADLVIGTVVFAGTAGDGEIHPDTAVKLMEWYVHELDKLDPSEQLWLVERARGRVVDEPTPEGKRALDSLASMLEESE